MKLLLRHTDSFVGRLTKFLKLLENQTSTHPSSSDLRTDDTSPTAPPGLALHNRHGFYGLDKSRQCDYYQDLGVNKGVSLSGVK